MTLLAAGDEHTKVSKDKGNTSKQASERVIVNEEETKVNKNVSDKTSELKLPFVAVNTRSD